MAKKNPAKNEKKKLRERERERERELFLYEKNIHRMGESENFKVR